MSRSLNYDLAKKFLGELFTEAESLLRNGDTPSAPDEFARSVAVLFESKTQSMREVALGFCLVRLLDKAIDLRSPYANQGDRAYNGRSLDEEVVNPFFQDRQIPASKGPYLAAFRRNIKFIAETRQGMRDKDGYDALLSVIATLEQTSSDEQLRNLTRYILFEFVKLRDRSTIPLATINRLNLDQYESLFTQLLDTPSGGLLPVLLTVAMLNAIKECYALAWNISWQGINVADSASGVGGDVSVYKNGSLQFAIEITERSIDRSRVVSTVNSKITPGGISDYMFIFTNTRPTQDARSYAGVLFNQGHEISFVEIKPWLINNLATMGGQCRAVFTRRFLDLLGDKNVPAVLKVKWNDLVKGLLG